MNKPPSPAPRATTRPLCRHCQHYYITHDPAFPYGCRAMDFKSKTSPHLAVAQATQGHCLTFLPRP